jgi:hypothetical protein
MYIGSMLPIALESTRYMWKHKPAQYFIGQEICYYLGSVRTGEIIKLRIFDIM